MGREGRTGPANRRWVHQRRCLTVWGSTPNNGRLAGDNRGLFGVQGVYTYLPCRSINPGFGYDWETNMDDDKRKIIATLGGLSAVGGAAVGTGAFSRVESQRGVSIQVAGDADAYLGLEPAEDSPNSSYTSFDKKGHLQIEMSEATEDTIGDGVNSNSITYFETVFQITNQGKAEIDVWIEHDSKYVTFEIDGAAIEAPEESVSLDVGESETVDIVVNTRQEPVPADGDVLLEQVVIYADTDGEGAPPDTGAMRIVSDDELSPGQSTTVTISIDLDGTADVDVFERFDTELGTATFESAHVNGASTDPSFVDLNEGGGVILFDEIGPGTVLVEYILELHSDTPGGVYEFDPNQLDVDTSTRTIDGDRKVAVVPE